VFGVICCISKWSWGQLLGPEESLTRVTRDLASAWTGFSFKAVICTGEIWIHSFQNMLKYALLAAIPSDKYDKQPESLDGQIWT